MIDSFKISCKNKAVDAPFERSFIVLPHNKNKKFWHDHLLTAKAIPVVIC
jgi:hypothetical protein